MREFPTIIRWAPLGMVVLPLFIDIWYMNFSQKTIRTMKSCSKKWYCRDEWSNNKKNNMDKISEYIF